MIDIIIADDHSIVRHGIQQFIALAPDMNVTGTAASAQEVFTALARCPCDLMLLDMTMPGRSGVELIKRIMQLEAAPVILVLSMHNEGQLVSRALKAGAAGYITKDCDPEHLLGAIRKVAEGGRYIDPSLVDELVFGYGLQDPGLPHEKLTNRELQVFRQLAAGESVNSIANNLSLSAKTISTYKLRLMQKMQMRSIADLVRYSLQHGLTLR